MGDKAMPCEQSQGSLGGSVAFLLRVLPGFSPPCIDPCLWNTGGDEPSLSLRFGSNDDIFLKAMALDSVQETGKRHWSQTPSHCVIAVRLMREAPEKIRPGFCKVGKGLDFNIPSIPEKHAAFLCSCDDGIDRGVSWHGPRSQRTMTKHPAFIVPYGLHFGSSFGGTPSSAWREVLQDVRKPTSCAVD